MTDEPWKRLERETAKRLGGQRILQKGRSVGDVDVAGLVAECKYGEQVPKKLVDWYKQAEGYRKNGEIVAVITKRPRQTGELVTISMADFEKLWHAYKEAMNLE